MGSQPRVILAKRRAGAAIGGHPWVFAGAVARVEGAPKDGDAVIVTGGDDGRFIAHGLYNSQSEIRVRLYSWDEGRPLSSEFFASRLREAVLLRSDVLGLRSPKGACRLVFSESDGLSGLVADEYAGYLVVQLTSRALACRLEDLTASLIELAKPAGILLRGVRGMSKREGLEMEDRVLWGEIPSQPIRFEQGRLTLEVEIGVGQKTGFYLDQRENRLAVAALAVGKRVLDLHTYTGGFALHCAKAGAREVIGVDSSKPAIDQAQHHVELNRLTNVRFVEQDVFDFLREYKGDPFDIVILDPPRLAPTQSAKHRALRMYHRLNTEAFRALKPGGILVSCSCSGAIASDEWLSLLSSAARRSNRLLQVLEVRGAGRDHPFSIHCPESRYLKCVIARTWNS